jgi:hypothetical protein
LKRGFSQAKAVEDKVEDSANALWTAIISEWKLSGTLALWPLPVASKGVKEL